VTIAGLDDRLRLFGEFDATLSAVERLAGVDVRVEGDELVVTGERARVDEAKKTFDRLIAAAKSGEYVTAEDVGNAASVAQARPLHDSLATSRRGRPVRPRTAGQRIFVEAISANTLTFAVGPAGTGKTFLAVVMAVAALRAGDVQRIVLSRPAVEAGENLGFLPGDFQAKVDPYLRPLFDALGEIMEPQAVSRAVERGQIEVAPLAYMRGRTLSDAFIVLDEAQNASRDQMKMFLTRIGAQSRMVVCGDITQIDLVRRQDSGLVHAARVFTNVNDVAVVTLGEADIVRHPLIRKILKAYDRADG
jgi:phosphate starvation-inducible protein PhoH and related proteins